MKFELPFKLLAVREVGHQSFSYKVFVYGNKVYSEIITDDRVAEIIRLDGASASDDELLEKCSSSNKWWVRGPIAVYSSTSSKGLRRDSIRICRRANCGSCEEINGVKVVEVFEDATSAAIVYRKGGEYYAVIDDLAGFGMVRLSDAKPRRLLFGNGVLLAYFGDFVRIVSPKAGIVDLALIEDLEPLGVNAATNSTVILFSKSSNIVFEASRTGSIEPLGSCASVIAIREIDGGVRVLCDLEVLNGSFLPFYAGKFFVDVFRDTSDFSIVSPYIFSVVNVGEHRYFVAAKIEPSPIYIRVTRHAYLVEKRVINNIRSLEIEGSILKSIEDYYGAIEEVNDSVDEPILSASMYYGVDGRSICLGDACGECIIKVNKLASSVIDLDRAVLKIMNKTYEPSQVFPDSIVFTVDEETTCSSLASSNKLGLCIGKRCLRIPLISKNAVESRLQCTLLGFSDVDEIVVECSMPSGVSRVISYTPCRVVEDGGKLRVYSREQDCLLGLVSRDGYVVKQRLDFSIYEEHLSRRVGGLENIGIVDTGNGYALVSLRYNEASLAPISVNDVFSVFKAPYLVLRLSGSVVVRARDRDAVRSFKLDLPETSNVSVKAFLRDNVVELVCPGLACTLFCGKEAASGNRIKLRREILYRDYCNILITGKGFSKIVKLSPIIEAVRLAALVGRRVAEISKLA